MALFAGRTAKNRPSMTKKVHMYIIQLTLIEIYLESFFDANKRETAEEFRKIAAIFFRRDFRGVFTKDSLA